MTPRPYYLQAIGVWVQFRYRQVVLGEEGRVGCDIVFQQQLREGLCIKLVLAVDLQGRVTYRIISVRVRGIQGEGHLVSGAQLPDLILSQCLTHTWDWL